MLYEEFKREITTHIKDYLPAVYRDWEIRITEVLKVNGKLEAMHILPTCGTCATPNLYFREMFDYYIHCGDFSKVCKEVAAAFVVAMAEIPNIKNLSVNNMPKENIIFSLIPQAGNEELLSACPNRLTMNLAVIYRFVFYADDGGLNSTIITYDILKELNLTENDLYELANKNTPEILPPVKKVQDRNFILLTNERERLGATSILYPGLLNSLSDEIESDLFILPSSTHEVFIIPDMGQDIAELNSMIRYVNDTIVAQEDFLSNNAYKYTRDDNRVTIAIA